MQFDRTIGSTRVLNAGSVGMPFAGAERLSSGVGELERHRSQFSAYDAPGGRFAEPLGQNGNYCTDLCIGT
jgi:hypothetical protein